MENKLNQLKEEYCKWYCEYDKDMSYCVCGGCDKEDCYPCDVMYIYPCEYCKVNEFIKHIRDEI